MGVFTEQIEIGSPDGTRFEGIEAVVDSGSSYSQVPASLLRRLGVVAHRRTRLRLADGRVVERELGRAWARVLGESVITLVVLADEGSEPLLGAYTWRALGSPSTRSSSAWCRLWGTCCRGAADKR